MEETGDTETKETVHKNTEGRKIENTRETGQEREYRGDGRRGGRHAEVVRDSVAETVYETKIHWIQRKIQGETTRETFIFLSIRRL
jgi:hypothetical protein